MKVKITTQLDGEAYKALKMSAAKERRQVGELIQIAITDYLNKGKRPPGQRYGLKRLMAGPAFKLSDKQFREIMEADFYDQ